MTWSGLTSSIWPCGCFRCPSWTPCPTSGKRVRSSVHRVLDTMDTGHGQQQPSAMPSRPVEAEATKFIEWAPYPSQDSRARNRRMR
jgi:hypothetical protein